MYPNFVNLSDPPDRFRSSCWVRNLWQIRNLQQLHSKMTDQSHSCFRKQTRSRSKMFRVDSKLIINRPVLIKSSSLSFSVSILAPVCRSWSSIGSIEGWKIAVKSANGNSITESLFKDPFWTRHIQETSPLGRRTCTYEKSPETSASRSISSIQLTF